MKVKKSEVVSRPLKSSRVVAKIDGAKKMKPNPKVVDRRQVGRPRKSSHASSTSRSSDSDSSDSESESDSDSSAPPNNFSEESSDESSSSSGEEEVTPPPARVVRKKRFTLEMVEYNPEIEIAHARNQERLRRTRPKQEERAPVEISEKDYKKVARECMKRTQQLFILWKLNENDMEKKDAEKLLQSNRSKRVPEEVEKAIMLLIEEGVKLQVMTAQKTRKCMTVDKVKMYVNEDQFGTKISEKAHFEYTEINFVSSAPEDAQLREDLAIMNNFEEHKDMCCSCVGNCNPKTCLCIGLQKEFAQSEMADRHRYYTCGPGCACKGKCSFSLIDVPIGGTEVMLHHYTPKGFGVRSVQYFYPGAMVTEITGEITNTANLPFLDDYSIDMTSVEADEKAIVAIIDNKRTKSKVVRDAMNHLSKKYKLHLKKTLRSNYSINPINFSTFGRFLSSSCFANVMPSVVFSQGLSPLNVRCIFRAIMPIFPNQEIAFSYSDEYIYQQLRDICKCGSLCCIRNRQLYPFLRMHHFEKFYELLFTQLFNEFNKNVLEPVNNEIRSRLRSSSTPPDGPARKKLKAAPVVSVPTHRVKRSRRKRTPAVPFKMAC